MTLAHLLATVWLTLPGNQAVGRCDSLVIVCDSAGVECDTLPSIPETRLSRLRIWWWERWAAEARLLREENVGGLEGRRYSIDLPDFPVASVYVTAVDSAGNESCPSNFVTVNAPLSVETPLGHEVVYYDVSGRRVERAAMRPGIYWREERTPTTRSRRKMVVLR